MSPSSAGVAGATYAMGAAAADFDNDGDQDLFVAGVGRNQLFRNDGTGRFTDVAEAAGVAGAVWSVAGVWLDYDRDGRLDLFVVNYVRWTPGPQRFCGDRTRDLRVYCHPKYFEGLPNTLYRNKGDGTLRGRHEGGRTGAIVGKGMSAALLDIDGDRWPDLYVTNDSVPSLLLRNTGKGTFEEIGLLAGVALPGHGRPISAMGVDAADVDGDGRPDLAVTALAGETFPLYRNEGGGAFRDAGVSSGLGALTVRRSGWGIVFGDFDNDGAVDLFTANAHVNDRIEQFEASPYLEPNRVYRNTGKGRFADVSATVGDAFQQPAAHRGAVAADLDGDGRLDVVTTALGGPAEIWKNVSTSTGHWLEVRLVGTARLRDGIGARVRVGTQVGLDHHVEQLRVVEAPGGPLRTGRRHDAAGDRRDVAGRLDSEGGRGGNRPPGDDQRCQTQPQDGRDLASGHGRRLGSALASLRPRAFVIVIDNRA